MNTVNKTEGHKNWRFVLVTSSLLIMTVATGCKTQSYEQVRSTSSAPVTELSDTGLASTASAVITMERGACYGRCPVYSVALFEDGNIYYNGQRFVDSVGVYRLTISPSEISALRARFQRQFLALRDTLFVPDSPSCGRYFTDAPSIHIAIHDGAKYHAVHLDGGCSKAPDFLKQFGAAIDSVARTSSFISRSGDVR